MKKILIVNNNLDMGGIQKSLINLLKEIHNDYNVTLLLFSKSGTLLSGVPNDVKIIEPNKCYRMLGLTRAELKQYPLLFIIKFFLMKVAAVSSRRSAMKLLGLFQKKIYGYDAAFSYSHLPHHKYFSNGCGDFVLDKVACKNKICLIHCDYLNSGCMTGENNAEYSEFDKIACCSESVKKRFIQGSNVEESKVYTLRNFYDLDIVGLAKKDPYHYDGSFVKLLTVARLTPEKGIEQAIDALYATRRKDIRYYIIGDGPQRELLVDKIANYNMKDQVYMAGEQANPYRYMRNADYLLVPSLHEAAPMVFDEAKILGLPIISTNTTSAHEMITNDSGIVCEDFSMLESVLKKSKKEEKKEEILLTTETQLKQFSYIENE